MSEVVGAVRQVAGIMSDITQASQEQSTGISQVNDAITQMEAITQQNAALVEQAAAASESLQQQASLLREAVAVFRTDHDSAPVQRASLATRQVALSAA